MPLPISGSPDITVLDFFALLDISGDTPSITITNNSVGNPSGTTNLNLCEWWYTIQAPNGYLIHAGSLGTPDFIPVLGIVQTATYDTSSATGAYVNGDIVTITGGGGTGATCRVTVISSSVTAVTLLTGGQNYTAGTHLSTTGGGGTGLQVDITVANKPIWSTFVLPSGTWISFTGGGMCAQVEFSNSVPYLITLYVQDTTPTTYSLTYPALLVSPNGLIVPSQGCSETGTCGNFGVGCLETKTICWQGILQVFDNTKYFYQGLMPATQSSSIKLTRPGSPSTTSIVNNSQSAAFFLYYDGNGFVVVLIAYSTYQLSANITVKIQYKAQVVLNVECNINLCKIACELMNYYKQAKRKCNTVDNSLYINNLTLLNTLYLQILTATIQPLCDIQVQPLIQEMKEIAGIGDCGCGCNGINPGSVAIPMPAGGGSGGGIVFLPIVQHGATTTPTAQCPSCSGWANNYVYDPTNTTQLGTPTVIYSIGEAISLVNGNTAWLAFGTAFDAGCCQMGFVLNPSFTGIAPTFVAFLE